MLTDVGTELTFQLPLGSSDKFQQLFNFIDSNLDNLAVQSYGKLIIRRTILFLK